MKKEISFSTRGDIANLGSLIINRMLPNRYADRVGPFVFLDYIAPVLKEMIHKNGMGAHPHRGIATLTYIIEGEEEHFDSAGNYEKIHSGGVQWMKAGTGIVHDGNLNYDSQRDSKIIHGFQFWINLPAVNKAEHPAHLAVQATDVPQKALPENSGSIKVVVGNYEELRSRIPNYSVQFLYHIELEPGKQFSMTLTEKIESAAFSISDNIILNDAEFQEGALVAFTRNSGEIEVKNNSQSKAAFLLFGGEEYTENIVAEGPFVMNSQQEIVEAYKDFYDGKYDKID
ncbi:pirin family protein [Flavobacterium sp. FlaQc-47]|uniref:pirin family protein n=1 Tax=Flavobacterium sp. FlaQc-47 TaxID=3374180 RepID=UPI0037579164